MLFERLLLLIYACGSGAGVRAVAAGDHPHTEDDLRYVRRRYLTVEGCREAARIIANATFAARQTAPWGEGTTAVASDSTHFSASDQNIFTEWHSRCRRAKRGVLIYWTVDVAGSMAVHSQLISCSASPKGASLVIVLASGIRNPHRTRPGPVALPAQRRCCAGPDASPSRCNKLA
ncbi:Tn3 family transposase [Nonomuraea jabiensis]|uniref:Tn3 family transposase n=1 Tax=Nonomuraea jabiensis TaxID=882448 RepID=UPI003D74A5CD